MKFTSTTTADGLVQETKKYRYLVSLGNLYQFSRRTFTGTILVSRNRKERNIEEAVNNYFAELDERNSK